MLIKGSGACRFYYPGGTAIAIGFDGPDKEIAAQAAYALVGGAAPWRIAERNKAVLVCFLKEGEATEAFEQHLRALFKLEIERCDWKHCRKKCADASIFSVPHSIDYGPTFTVEAEVLDPRQMSMFGEAAE
jgi:hypothetical protein